MAPALCTQSLYQQVVQGIASARRLTPAEVESAINDSPLLASQAMQLKLVDGLAYRWGDDVPAAPWRLVLCIVHHIQATTRSFLTSLTTPLVYPLTHARTHPHTHAPTHPPTSSAPLPHSFAYLTQ